MGHYAPSGFPIRKSPDQSLVAGSPGLIAGSYVLHRLLVPRHPPCALTNLATTDVMLASTVQFSRCGRSRPSTPPAGASGRPGAEGCRLRGRSLRTQQRARPRLAPQLAFPPGRRVPAGRTGQPRTRPRPNNQCSTEQPERRDPRGNPRAGAVALDAVHRLRRWPRQVLLRKEVIQPHLPVRLPCYDFVPIASPTFDGSLPDGLGHRLRVLPTFVT
jgi:hypothetical protein